MLVPYAELQATMRDILVREGMEPARAEHCAQLFADSSRDGVPSHGLNRFGRFVAMIRNRMVNVQARPVCTRGSGAAAKGTAILLAVPRSALPSTGRLTAEVAIAMRPGDTFVSLGTASTSL